MNRAKDHPPVTGVTDGAKDLAPAWAELLARLKQDDLPLPTRGDLPETVEELAEFERCWRQHAAL